MSPLRRATVGGMGRENDAALILFTLSPEAEGRRKRLGLGRPERAAAVFATLLEHLRTVAAGLSGVDLVVASPEGAEPTFAAGAGLRLPQRGESFGESLRLVVEDAFALGYRRVVVIGNDAPEISRDYLDDAFARLECGDRPAAVLGPARDGGYALLGLTAPCAEAFRRMPWGTCRVARLTEERLARAGCRVERLGVVDDVDSPRALARFLSRVARRRHPLAVLARALARLLRPAVGPPAPDAPRRRLRLVLAGRLLRAPPPLLLPS